MTIGEDMDVDQLLNKQLYFYNQPSLNHNKRDGGYHLMKPTELHHLQKKRKKKKKRDE